MTLGLWCLSAPWVNAQIEILTPAYHNKSLPNDEIKLSPSFEEHEFFTFGDNTVIHSNVYTGKRLNTLQLDAGKIHELYALTGEYLVRASGTILLLDRDGNIVSTYQNPKFEGNALTTMDHYGNTIVGGGWTSMQAWDKTTSEVLADLSIGADSWSLGVALMDDERHILHLSTEYSGSSILSASADGDYHEPSSHLQVHDLEKPEMSTSWDFSHIGRISNFKYERGSHHLAISFENGSFVLGSIDQETFTFSYDHFPNTFEAVQSHWSSNEYEQEQVFRFLEESGEVISFSENQFTRFFANSQGQFIAEDLVLSDTHVNDYYKYGIDDWWIYENTLAIMMDSYIYVEQIDLNVFERHNLNHQFESILGMNRSFIFVRNGSNVAAISLNSSMTLFEESLKSSLVHAHILDETALVCFDVNGEYSVFDFETMSKSTGQTIPITLDQAHAKYLQLEDGFICTDIWGKEYSRIKFKTSATGKIYADVASTTLELKPVGLRGTSELIAVDEWQDELHKIDVNTFAHEKLGDIDELNMVRHRWKPFPDPRTSFERLTVQASFSALHEQYAFSARDDLISFYNKDLQPIGNTFIENGDEFRFMLYDPVWPKLYYSDLSTGLRIINAESFKIEAEIKSLDRWDNLENIHFSKKDPNVAYIITDFLSIYSLDRTSHSIKEVHLSGNSFFQRSTLTASEILLLWQCESCREFMILDPLSGEKQTFEISSDDPVIGCWLINDDKTAIIAHSTGEYEFIHLVSGERMRMINLPDHEFLIDCFNGDYYATPNASAHISFKNGSASSSTMSIEVENNKPHVALLKLNSMIGVDNPALVQEFERAYEKRKATYSSLKSSGEDCSIRLCAAHRTSRYSQYTGVQITSSLPRERRYDLQLYVNDNLVPWIDLWAYEPASACPCQNDDVCASAEIKLSSGINKLECVVKKNDQIQFISAPEYIENKVSGSYRNVYFLGLGVEEYGDEEMNLRFCRNDILDMESIFRDRYGYGYQLVDTLFNEALTLQKLESQFSVLRRDSHVDDIVIVAYTGHGILDTLDNLHLTLSDTDFDSPAGTAISYQLLDSLLAEIPSRQKLLMIDACHSGIIDATKPRDKQKSSHEQEDFTAANYEMTSKGIIRKNKPSFQGEQSSFELMQYTFANLERGNGAVVVSASSGSQFAFEKNELENGVFTYSIIEALKQNEKLSVLQLKRLVENRVEELTNGEQRPTSRTQTFSYDWKL